jgi:hypothetical protein
MKRLLLCIILLSVFVTGLSCSPDITAPAQNSTNLNSTTTRTNTPAQPTTTTPTSKSVYDGTYTGTFSYQYQDYWQAKPGDYPWRGPWVSDEFELTITIQADTLYTCKVTSVQSSEPGFGTGSGGIAPTNGRALLPGMISSNMGPGIYIVFPNGAKLECNAGVLASNDGQSLWNPPDDNSTDVYGTWWADAPSGRFKTTELESGGRGEIRRIKFLTWSLTKVSSDYDSEIEALGLAPVAKQAAYTLKTKHPEIKFTSGRRTVSEQAQAMAANIVASGNRKWISQVYVAGGDLQQWVDNHLDAKTVDDIARGLEDTLNQMTDEQRGKISKHLTGEAFDVQPQTKDSEQVKNDIRALPGLTKFLEEEGGLVRWHAQF